jgi:hypothetical protein
MKNFNGEGRLEKKSLVTPRLNYDIIKLRFGRWLCFCLEVKMGKDDRESAHWAIWLS